MAITRGYGNYAQKGTAQWYRQQQEQARLSRESSARAQEERRYNQAYSDRQTALALGEKRFTTAQGIATSGREESQRRYDANVAWRSKIYGDLQGYIDGSGGTGTGGVGVDGTTGTGLANTTYQSYISDARQANERGLQNTIQAGMTSLRGLDPASAAFQRKQLLANVGQQRAGLQAVASQAAGARYATVDAPQQQRAWQGRQNVLTRQSGLLNTMFGAMGRV